ncbi:hypothetical protein CBS147353_11655 [Aspergillus niger]|nr:hypothetical protein CBS147353_11655 [Aspergillus niger]
MCVLSWGFSPSRYAHISQKSHSSYYHLYPPTTMETHLPRLNEFRKVLASAEKKSHSGTRLNASHYTESALPDDRKPNFQTVSGEAILTHENDASDRHGMSDVDSMVTIEHPEPPIDVPDMKALTSLICEYVLSYDVPNPAVIRPRTVLIYIFKSRNQSPKAEGQVKDQTQENHRLHRRVSSINESVPTSNTKSRHSARYKEMEAV